MDECFHVSIDEALILYPTLSKVVEIFIIYIKLKMKSKIILKLIVSIKA